MRLELARGWTRAEPGLLPVEIVAWAREHMANFKAPRVVEVVDELPLNASGKVLKFELRDRAVSSLQQGMTGDRT